MSSNDPGNPFRCFDRRYFGQVLVGAVALILVAVWARSHARGSPMRIGLAALEALVMGGLIAVTMIAIRRLDELQQRIHLEAIAIAFAVTGILVTGYGYLEKAGLPRVEWPRWIWPLMLLFWGLALLLRRRRYQ